MILIIIVVFLYCQTSVCRKIMEAVCQEGPNPMVVMISQDSFYRDLSQEQRERASRNQYNFDHPGKA